MPPPVRARPGRLSLSVSRSKSILSGAFVWARRALNRPKRRFPARAETADALRNYARDMVAISRGAGTKQMRDTRYVGDLRGRRTTYLDANSFKSYEGQSSMQLNAAWTVMLPCGPDDVNDGFMGKPPVCIFTMMEEGVVTLAPIGRGTAGLVERTRQALYEGISSFFIPYSR